MVRAPFEPTPLYDGMARNGCAQAVHRVADDDGYVWFFPAVTGGDGPGSMGARPTDEIDRGGVVVLDVRGMEPPEPLLRTLSALETLPADGLLVQVNPRVPALLFPRLEERGWTWEVGETDDGIVRVFIRRAATPREG